MSRRRSSAWKGCMARFELMLEEQDALFTKTLGAWDGDVTSLCI